MKSIRRIFSIAALALCALSMSYATTYFVNASAGNNANNGTASGTAFKTITHAISVATSTDVINVAAGTYNTAHHFIVLERRDDPKGAAVELEHFQCSRDGRQQPRVHL